MDSTEAYAVIRRLQEKLKGVVISEVQLLSDIDPDKVLVPSSDALRDENSALKEENIELVELSRSIGKQNADLLELLRSIGKSVPDLMDTAKETWATTLEELAKDARTYRSLVKYLKLVESTHLVS